MPVSPATARLEALASLSQSDLAGLAAMGGRTRRLNRGETLIQEGERSPGNYLLLEGYMAGTFTFPTGARQMLALYLAGDMLGSTNMVLTQAATTVTALTAVVVMPVSTAAFGRMISEHPRLGAMMFMIAQQERVTLMDRLASLGRTSAKAKLAAFVSQIQERVRYNDPDVVERFNLPLTQADLADLIGISAVHLNGVLKTLRDEGVMRWDRGVVTIFDQDRLQATSGLPARTFVRDPEWLPPSV